MFTDMNYSVVAGAGSYVIATLCSSVTHTVACGYWLRSGWLGVAAVLTVSALGGKSALTCRGQ